MPSKMAFLLGSMVQGLGKSHGRGSAPQHTEPAETLSCPGTDLGPQTAARDALCHPLS